jgi:excisionase family DNA binding protein
MRPPPSTRAARAAARRLTTEHQIQLDLDRAPPPNHADGLNGNRAHRDAYDRPLTRDDVMTAREVGVLLHLPGSSVYDLARRGALPGHRVGRAWRFIRDEIELWLRAS